MTSTNRHIGRSIVALLFAVLFPVLASAQYPTVGNRFVSAMVDDQRGLVTVLTTPTGYYGALGGKLSFQDESFLTVDIDGKIYTNNDGSGLDTAKNFGSYLRNASTTRNWDTITCAWKLPSGDLYQDVYPVEFEYSGQIVLRWRFRSRSNNPMRIQMQYLLDTRIRSNDKAKVLTRYGYRNSWARFADGNVNYPPIPSFFQAFEKDLTAANGFNPRLVSQGTLISPELGLIKPDAVLVGDWTVLSYYLWGYPGALPDERYGDSAILMTFPGTAVLSGKMTEIGRTAYGTGEFETCTGDLYALIFRPRKLKPNAKGDGYTPNPFNIDVYLFNTDPFTQASNALATLIVGPHLTILDSGTTKNGTENSKYAVPRAVPVEGVSVVSWQVLAEKTCDETPTSLEVQAISALNNPSFNQTCKLPLLVPCLDRDTLAPQAEPEVTTNFTKSMDFSDNRPKDKGIRSVTTDGYDPLNFDVTVDSYTPCTLKKVSVHILQKDSTKGGCIDIHVTDCAGNTTNEQICFPKYPLHPDDHAPIIHLIERRGSYDSSICNMKWDSLLATDDTSFDRGLLSIEVAPGSKTENMALVSEAFVPGSSRHGFFLRVLDSLKDGCITIRVTDVQGFTTDSQICYCTIPDTHPPVVTIFKTDPYHWSVFVEDAQPWDRGIDTISVRNRLNVRLLDNGVPIEPNRSLTRGKSSYGFNVEVIDTMFAAGFCVQAKDLADSSSLLPTANWWTQDTCVTYDSVEDSWDPTITMIPVSPTRVRVTVNDVHFIGSQKVGWDRGIDSVWFTVVKGMTTPKTIHAGCSATVDTFDIFVTDSLTLDSISTICVNAVDCRRNFAIQRCFRYPIIGDSLPPVMNSIATLQTSLDLVVTDSTTYDRGLEHTWLDQRENFEPFDHEQMGERELTVRLGVTKPRESATGVLTSIDLVGTQSNDPFVREAHTTRAPISIWVQDLKLKPGSLVKQNTNFTIPLFFSANDTFTLARKNITKYKFEYEIVGDPGFSFVGVDKTGTASADFTVNSVVTGNRMTVDAVSNTGKPLDRMDLSLIDLVLHSDANEVTRQANLRPVELAPSVSIIFNEGEKRIVTDNKFFSVELPNPVGSISGGSIVSQGSCTPLVDSLGVPTQTYLDPASPNPFRGSTKLYYAVPGEGPVVLSVYNNLGLEVTKLVNTVLSQGYYQAVFNAAGLASGTYYARLEAGGKIITRTLRLSN